MRSCTFVPLRGLSVISLVSSRLVSSRLTVLRFHRDAHSLSFAGALFLLLLLLSILPPSPPRSLCYPLGKLRLSYRGTHLSFGALRLKSLFVLFFFVTSPHPLFYPRITSLRSFSSRNRLGVPHRFSPLRDSSRDSLRFTTSCVYIVLSLRNAYV